MKVAVDISPLRTGHKVRGIGSYTEKLTEEFKKGDWKIQFDFFEDPKSPPPADVIHYPYFDLFFYTLPFKKTASRVVTIHDVIPLVFPNYFPVGVKGYINLFFQKRSLKNVDAVICDSQASKKDIVAKLSFPEDKIHVIYLAPGSNFKPITNREHLASISKRYHLPKEFVLYVGDVNWNKNIQNLLEAVKLSKVALVMVGDALVDRGLPETLDIDKKIKKLAIGEKVIKTGFIDESDLVALYNLASATILPSFYEGFGLPVLESMACGTPVVCSQAASLSEIADSAAFFCEPVNAGDIARRIKDVLNLKERERENLFQKLVNHAKKFTWQKIAKQTIGVYQSLV